MGRGILLAVAVTLGLAGAAAADGRAPLSDAEAANWRGVGRLNIAGSRFCTAVLISDSLVATAAHCLYNPRTRARVPLTELRFVAGLRNGAHAAARRVARAAIAPEFRFDGRATAERIAADVAVLELERPIPAAEAPAYPLGAAAAGTMTIISYSRDRAHAPSIERGCAPTARSGRVAALSCTAIHGASGSPVFVETPAGPRLVALVSAQTQTRNGARQALVVDAARTLERLRGALTREAAVAPGVLTR